jgi:hypothetical protein
MAWLVMRLDVKDAKGAGRVFRQCVWTGILLFVGIFGDLAVKLWGRDKQRTLKDKL